MPSRAYEVLVFGVRILTGHSGIPSSLLSFILVIISFFVLTCANSAEIPSSKIVEAPVIIDGQTLFRVRGISALPAERRADEIASRILTLAADENFSVDTIKTVETSVGTKIMGGNTTILVVLDVDAELEQIDRVTLSEAYVRRIAEAIENYRESREPQNLIRNTGLLAAATLALGIFFWVGRLILVRVDHVLDAQIKVKLKGLEKQSFRILSANHLWTVLRGVRYLLWIIAALAVVVVYINFVLQLFPWTRFIGNRFLDLLLDPLEKMGKGALQFIPDLFFLVILFIITRYLLKAIRLFFNGLSYGGIRLEGFDREWAWPTYRIVRLLVIVFALIMAYPYIPGSDSGAFKGISLFLGVIFSLGSTSVIANMIAGYSLIYRRAFRVGDRVKINEHIGDVMQSRLLVTHLQTPKNEIVVIPNSIILNTSVVNYTNLAEKGQLILHTTVGIGYETPWRQVEAMLIQAADHTPNILKNPAPFVLQKSLGDFCVTYELNVYVNDAKGMARHYALLHQNILDVFNEYGVQIMTPNYENDPAEPKLVAKAKWFTAPARKPEPSSDE